MAARLLSNYSSPIQITTFVCSHFKFYRVINAGIQANRQHEGNGHALQTGVKDVREGQQTEKPLAQCRSRTHVELSLTIKTREPTIKTFPPSFNLFSLTSRARDKDVERGS